MVNLHSNIYIYIYIKCGLGDSKKISGDELVHTSYIRLDHDLSRVTKQTALDGIIR